MGVFPCAIVGPMAFAEFFISLFKIEILMATDGTIVTGGATLK